MTNTIQVEGRNVIPIYSKLMNSNIWFRSLLANSIAYAMDQIEIQSIMIENHFTALPTFWNTNSASNKLAIPDINKVKANALN